MNHAFVVLLGMGTVFVGLVCIVFLCMGMRALIQKFQNAENTSEPQQVSPAPVKAEPIADRQAIIAGACAVIAEELGEEVKNIKVVSFKRV